MKKLLAISMATLFSIQAYATPFDGFYAGANVGGSRLKVKTSEVGNVIVNVPGAFNLDLGTANNPKLVDDSWIGAIDIGFSKVIKQHLYLAVEAMGQLENASVGTNTGVDNGSVDENIIFKHKYQAKLDNELALTFNPGIVFNQTTLLYGKIGPAWGHFSSRDELQYVQPLAPDLTLSGDVATHDSSAYHVGLRLGLGMEHYLTQKLSMKLEYLNTNYGSINSGKTHSSPVLLNGEISPLPDEANISESNKGKAYNNSIMFGLTYHFGN